MESKEEQIQKLKDELRKLEENNVVKTTDAQVTQQKKTELPKDEVRIGKKRVMEYYFSAMTSMKLGNEKHVILTALGDRNIGKAVSVAEILKNREGMKITSIESRTLDGEESNPGRVTGVTIRVERA